MDEHDDWVHNVHLVCHFFGCELWVDVSKCRLEPRTARKTIGMKRSFGVIFMIARDGVTWFLRPTARRLVHVKV